MRSQSSITIIEHFIQITIVDTSCSGPSNDCVPGWQAPISDNIVERENLIQTIFGDAMKTFRAFGRLPTVFKTLGAIFAAILFFYAD